MALQLTSSAFSQGEMIPRKYTCDGEDVSPPLQWTEAPEGTESFALIMDDPDAPVGTWDHWVLYNLSPAKTSLDEGVPASQEIPGGGLHGKNSWGRPGYGGPCPPGGTHRYFFRLYALDTTLALAAGAGKEQVEQAIEGHVLAEGNLMGRYRRG